MKLIITRNYSNLFVHFFMVWIIFGKTSNINFKNPNLILKACSIQEKRASVSLLNEEFLQKTMLVKKTGALAKKGKGSGQWITFFKS